MSVTLLERPAVSNPRPHIRLDSQDSALAAEQLVSMDMREQEGGLSSLTLRLSNVVSRTDGSAGAAFEDEAELALGSRITIATGPQDEQQEIFRGVVTALEAEYSAEGPPELLVLAEDALQHSRISRRTRVFLDQSLAEVVRGVARELSLQIDVSELNGPSGTWVQLNESDLAFLRRLLRGVDADLQVVNDTLEVAPRDAMQRELIEMRLMEDLRSVRFVADLAHQVTAVTSAGWNASTGEAVRGRGEGSSLGPGSGRSGAELLRQALGERVEHVGQVAVTSREEARALADALFDRRARGFVTAEGTADGHPRIRVGAHLELRGVSPRFENTYFVVATHHRYNVHEGYMTDFRAECAYLGEPA